MPEPMKYNLKDELLKSNEKLNKSIALLGMSALSVPAYNNSMRSVMFTSHLKQFVTLQKTEFPGVFTNAENTVGKHSSGYKKTKRDYEVFRKIDKFADIIGTPYTYKLFLYNEKQDRYEVVTRKPSENLTEMFGFDYNNDVIDSLGESDFVPKGTVLYKSTSYDENMNYGYGMNVPVMYTLDPFTSEDAAVVSESLAKKMTSIEIKDVSVSLNDNEYLINLYGDDDNYQPLPHLGQYVNGLVCAKRPLHTNQLLSDFKDSAVKKINPTMDRIFYKDGEVVDIDIYCNNEELEENSFNSQILMYLNSQTKYYQEIYDTCDEIIHSGSKYSHDIEYLYKRSRDILDPSYKWKEGDTTFSNLIINMTIRKVIPLRVGQKITGRSGNKSVIAQIRKDEDMPKYDGKIVHLLLNALAIVNRTTAFPLYEITLNFIGNRIIEKMKTMSSLKEKEVILFDVIKNVNENQYKQMKAVYDTLPTKEKKEYIEDVIRDRIYFHIPPMWETKPLFYAIRDLYQKYGDILQPYDMYIHKWGRDIKMLSQQFIGEMYIMKLKQTSRKGFSVRSTGAVNSKGLPERSYKDRSHQEKNSETPIRFGVYETLNFSIGILPEDIALFHMMYRTSVKGRKDLGKALLNNTEELDIDKSYDNEVAKIFSVIFKSLGCEVKFKDSDKQLTSLDNSTFKEYDFYGLTLITTEYDFFMRSRKKEIEDSILAEYGVLDSEILDKMVLERMKPENYIMA